MKKFESFRGIDNYLQVSTQLVAAKPLCRLIEAYTENVRIFKPDVDGMEVMVEEVLGGSIVDSLFEPLYMGRGFFITCILTDGQYGLTVVVSDED